MLCMNSFTFQYVALLDVDSFIDILHSTKPLFNAPVWVRHANDNQHILLVFTMTVLRTTDT